MIGERLARARAAAGLSMQALGQQAGVSANMIKKYEHDLSMPGSDKLIELAKAVGVRSEYFFRPVKVELEDPRYRKRANVPARTLKRIDVDVLEQAERWQELANLWPNFPIPAFEPPKDLPRQVASLEELDDLAIKARKIWDLGGNPIPDLIDVLESRGILVITIDVNESAKFDGLQATVAGKPVIVISANWPGDRQRFTLAHELGHLFLRGRSIHALDEEKACHRFAASFLLPADAIRRQLGQKRHNLEIRELYLLKQEYGLSMQACLYRAANLGIISEGVRKKLFMLFSRKGWRKQEPGIPYPPEKTLLFQQLVYRALGEGIIGESKAAELLGIPLVKFCQGRMLELADAVVDQ